MLALKPTRALRWASRIPSLPGVRLLSPSADRVPSAQDIEGYRRSQELALRGAREIAGLLQEGWTEKHAADLLDTWLNDHGVGAFFHRSFAWWGDRTRFDGVRRNVPGDFLPSNRVLRPNEVVILDVAPIVDGYISDIGYTTTFGDVPEYEEARQYLAELYERIPAMFSNARLGRDIWQDIDQDMQERGFDNIHAIYPFSVLGHRVHQVSDKAGQVGRYNFGWQSYWALLSRGVLGQLLNHDFEGSLTGLWAIEPHIGMPGFGAKFEEILAVDGDEARWIGSGESCSLTP